jgi:Flp pilus assembly protein CpaB
VLVVARDLALGTTLGATDVRSESRYASTVPEAALASIDEATGRTVVVPVLEGSVLLAPHLADPGRDGMDGLVGPGSRAVRVHPEDGLRPPVGAVVDVMAAIDPTFTGRAGADVVARSARVLAVDAPDGAGIDDTTGVTLLVTEDEARELAFATANGVVMLAIAPPEDACCSPPGS